jgi:hyperosmotically inducible protein
METKNMKRTMVYAVLSASLLASPIMFNSGCAVTSGRETAGDYAKDKEIAAKIKASMYKDKLVKGTQIEVQCLNGQVQLSGFCDSQEAKERAGQIASSTRGVMGVNNSILLPTGR